TRRGAGVVVPAAVEIRQTTFVVRGPDDLRHRLRELLVALLGGASDLLERSLSLATLGLPQQLALAADLLVLAIELDEDRDLRAKDVGVERLRDVVDGADRV